MLQSCSRPGGQERDPTPATPGPRGSCSCRPAASPRDAGVRGGVGAGGGWQVGCRERGTGTGPAPGLPGLLLAQSGSTLPARGHWKQNRLLAFRGDSGWQFTQGPGLRQLVFSLQPGGEKLVQGSPLRDRPPGTWLDEPFSPPVLSSWTCTALPCSDPGLTPMGRVMALAGGRDCVPPGQGSARTRARCTFKPPASRSQRKRCGPPCMSGGPARWPCWFLLTGTSVPGSDRPSPRGGGQSPTLSGSAAEPED